MLGTDAVQTPPATVDEEISGDDGTGVVPAPPAPAEDVSGADGALGPPASVADNFGDDGGGSIKKFDSCVLYNERDVDGNFSCDIRRRRRPQALAILIISRGQDDSGFQRCPPQGSSSSGTARGSSVDPCAASLMMRGAFLHSQPYRPLHLFSRTRSLCALCHGLFPVLMLTPRTRSRPYVRCLKPAHRLTGFGTNRLQQALFALLAAKTRYLIRTSAWFSDRRKIPSEGRTRRYQTAKSPSWNGVLPSTIW